MSTRLPIQIVQPIAIELDQPPKPDPAPLDSERAPEYAPCLACGRRHSREGEHIACLNRHLCEVADMVRMFPEYRKWLAAKEGIPSARQDIARFAGRARGSETEGARRMRFAISFPVEIHAVGTLYSKEDKDSLTFEVEADTHLEAKRKLTKRLEWILYGSEKDHLK